MYFGGTENYFGGTENYRLRSSKQVRSGKDQRSSK